MFALAQAMEHIGRMARTAADAAALLVAIAGPDPNDPTAHITLYPISCPTWALGRQAFDRMVDVNLKMARLCIREELCQMVKQEGGVIASIPGLVGLRTSSIYVAAKHGVSGLTKPAAIEYAADRVRVNAVAPNIETDMTKDAMVRCDEQSCAAAEEPSR